MFELIGSPTATAGNAWATVSWTAPSMAGGSAITDYTVTASPGGRQCVTNSGSTTSCTVTGLANGTAHTFTVTASSAAGTSPASPASNSVTPAGVAGPLDTVTGAAAGYSVRQLRAAYSGPSLRVRHATHGAEADLYFDTAGNLGTGNVLSITSAGSSGFAVNQSMTLSQFANGGSVAVLPWHDPSGNARDLPAVSGREPNLVSSGTLRTLNSRAAVRFDASALSRAGVLTGGATPWTFLGVATHELGMTELFGWGDSGGTGHRAGIWLDSGRENAFESQNVGRRGSALGVGTAFLRSFSYAGGTIDPGVSGWLNGSGESLGNLGANATLAIPASGDTVMGDVPTAIGAHPHRGQVGEIIVYPSALARNARESVEQSAATYFGLPYAPAREIAGTVFEDVNYGGGVGRNRATALTAGGSGRSSVRVELFNAAGNDVTFATTDGSGNYVFPNLAADNYTVRVVNSSVSSARTGYAAGTHLAVQTYRTDAASGTAADVVDRVGGETPNLADAGNGSTTLAALTTGSTTARSITAVTVSSANVAGVDFGFSFSLIVNANDTGQGSLRQFITNANALDHASLAINGRTAATEHAVFMISNGTASPGLRASLNYFAAVAAGPYPRNVATITLGTSLPGVTASAVIDAQTQPGWTLHPIVEVRTTLTGLNAFDVTVGSSTIRGFVINNFLRQGATGGYGIWLRTSGGNTVHGNWIGLTAAGNAGSSNGNALVLSSGSNTIGGSASSQRNVISGNGNGNGVSITAGTGNVVQGNWIGLSADRSTSIGNTTGINLSGGNNTQIGTDANGNGTGNVISGNAGLHGIYVNSSGAAIRGNLIGTDLSGTAARGNWYGIYLARNSSSATVGGTAAGARNVISGHFVAGILIDAWIGNNSSVPTSSAEFRLS